MNLSSADAEIWRKCVEFPGFSARGYAELAGDNDIIKGIVAAGRPLWEAIERDSEAPKAAQTAVLRQILKENSDTEFGKKHGFASIKSAEDYRKRVPVQTYERLEPLIKAQDNEKKPYLTADNPVRYFKTSGTTGHAKYIPVLEKTIEQGRHRSALFNFLHFSDPSTFFSGKVLSFVGPIQQGVTEAGTPCGSGSGFHYDLVPDAMMHKFVLPKHFLAVTDYEAKYLLMAGMALAEPDICLIVGANPGIFGKFQAAVRAHWEDLLQFLAKGDVTALGLDRKYSRFLPRGFRGNPDRERQLRSEFRDGSKVLFRNLWPKIHTVVAWTTGSCGAILPRVRPDFPPGTRFLDPGYVASEIIATLTVDAATNLQLPTFYHNFFEFAEVDDWEKNKDKARFLGLEEIRQGRRYHIFITAWNGLYRYCINDIVEVTGRFKKVPTICFVEKGFGVTDLATERLHEGQVVDAIQAIYRKHEVACSFFLMCGDRKEKRYMLFLETETGGKKFLEEIFERELSTASFGYEHVRNENLLKPLKVVLLKKGAGEAYREHCVARGQQDAQFKAMTLQYREECDFDFTPFQKS